MPCNAHLKQLRIWITPRTAHNISCFCILPQSSLPIVILVSWSLATQGKAHPIFLEQQNKQNILVLAIGIPYPSLLYRIRAVLVSSSTSLPASHTSTSHRSLLFSSYFGYLRFIGFGKEERYDMMGGI